jgi:hypothetical protein
MAVPEYKTGDTFPAISGTISDANGPVNIFAASSIRFIAKTGSTVIAGAATKIDDNTVPLRGKWSYSWGPSDLLAAGTYTCELEVTWSTGVIETFPSKDTNNPTFTVSADLD